jgi:hypothetical protein
MSNPKTTRLQRYRKRHPHSDFHPSPDVFARASEIEPQAPQGNGSQDDRETGRNPLA